MSFIVSDTKDYQFHDGAILEWSGPEDSLCDGACVSAVIDKDHTEQLVINKLGHLMTGDGTRLEDLVADITVGGERFGMRRFGNGQLGSRWVIVGPPYDEPLAT